MQIIDIHSHEIKYKFTKYPCFPVYTFTKHFVLSKATLIEIISTTHGFIL